MTSCLQTCARSKKQEERTEDNVKEFFKDTEDGVNKLGNKIKKLI